MSELDLRIATLNDLVSLNRVKRKASLVSDEHREALLAHPSFLAVSEDQVRAGQVLIAENQHQIIGLVAISRKEDGLELDGLFVDPAHWRQGIGRLLIEGVLACFSGTSAEVLHVVAGPDAKAFYLACGFRVVGNTDTEFGPAVIMTCDRT